MKLIEIFNEKILSFIYRNFGLCDGYTQIKEIDVFLCGWDITTFIWCVGFFIYALYLFNLEFKHYKDSSYDPGLIE